MRIINYVDIVVFFSLAYSVKVDLQIFFSILSSHKGGIIFTRFHAFMYSSSMIFIWWRNMGMVNTFYNSCDTMIWVRIIPVKVYQSLTGIFRTYIIIHGRHNKNMERLFHWFVNKSRTFTWDYNCGLLTQHKLESQHTDFIRKSASTVETQTMQHNSASRNI